MDEIGIDQIVELVKEPFIVLKDKNGDVIYDNSTLAAKCPLRHIHKYPLVDIVSYNGINKCITCCVGNKSSTFIRTTVEEVLGVPFVFKRRLEGSLEFYNPIIKVVVICGDLEVINDGYVVINFKPTMSVKKIKNVLYEKLKDHIPTASLVAPLAPKVEEVIPLRTRIKKEIIDAHSGDTMYIENCI